MAFASQKSLRLITSFSSMFVDASVAQASNQEVSDAPHRCHDSQPHAKFSADEDTKLRTLVSAFGSQDWYAISLRMPGRTSRQCKERWVNYLSPTLNTAPWTAEEDQLLLQKQREFGSRWAQIAKCFKNRTDGMVKNRFNRLQRRQARVYEVNLRYDATALLWMLGVAPMAKSQKKRPEPVPEVVPIETDLDFELWTDPIEADFFEF
jgi:hypothetical protein